MQIVELCVAGIGSLDVWLNLNSMRDELEFGEARSAPGPLCMFVSKLLHPLMQRCPMFCLVTLLK